MKTNISKIIAVIALLLALCFSYVFAEDSYGRPKLHFKTYEIGEDGEIIDLYRQLYVCYSADYVKDIDGSTRQCGYMYSIYYRPESGIFPEREYSEEGYLIYNSGLPDIRDLVILSPKIELACGTVMQIGDTIVAEAQTDGIGAHYVLIEAKRDNQWIEVAKTDFNTTEYDEDISATAEYTIQSQDSKLRVKSYYSLADSSRKKPRENDFFFIVDVGVSQKNSPFLSIVAPISFVFLAAVIWIGVVNFNKKFIVKRQKNKDS